NEVVGLRLLGGVVGRGRPAGARARTAAAVVPMDQADLEPGLELLAELRLELALEEGRVDDAAFVTRRRGGADVVEPALGLLVPVAGQAELQPVGDRTGDRGLQQVAVVVR